MSRHKLSSILGALALAASVAVVSHAQQAPAAGAPQTPPQPDRRVVVVGENPAVRKLVKEGGTALSNADFFRVTWSPAGAGSICAIRITDPANEANNLRIAVYDNKAVLDYMVAEIRKDYGNYTPMQGTITQKDTHDGGFTRTETCKTDKYTVDLVWKNLGQARFSDAQMFKNTVSMAMTMVPAESGDIIINGKPGPGTWYAKGGGVGTGAYLMLAEVWRR